MYFIKNRGLEILEYVRLRLYEQDFLQTGLEDFWITGFRVNTFMRASRDPMALVKISYLV